MVWRGAEGEGGAAFLPGVGTRPCGCVRPFASARGFGFPGESSGACALGFLPGSGDQLLYSC